MTDIDYGALVAQLRGDAAHIRNNTWVIDGHDCYEDKDRLEQAERLGQAADAITALAAENEELANDNNACGREIEMLVAKYENELADLRAREAELRAALVELVECKRLKDDSDAMMEKHGELQSAPIRKERVLYGDMAVECHALRKEYEQRKPLAWARARAAIAKSGPIGVE